MALVKIDAIDDTLHGLVERSIFENDICGLTAEFERCFFMCTGDGFLDDLAYISRTGERNFINTGMVDDSGTCSTGTGYNIYHTRRQPRFLDYFCEFQRGEWCCFSWF